MQRRTFFGLLAALGLAVGAGCVVDDGDRRGALPTVEGPADPTARFEELTEKYKSSTFSVLYSCGCGFRGDRPDEMLFTKSGPLWRTDEVSVGDYGVGASTIGGDTPQGSQCIWSVDEPGASFDVECSRLEGFAPTVQLLIEDAESVVFERYGMTLGMRSDCFRINPSREPDFARTFGEVCFSEAGIPLYVYGYTNTDSQRMRQYVAMSLQPGPADDTWRHQVIPDDRWPGVGTTEFTDLAMAELSLPDTPLVRQLTGRD